MRSFEQEGVVSVWIFLQEEDPADAAKDVLKDFCGVEYYDLDSQEGVVATEPRPLASLLGQLSYAESFIKEALAAAERSGISEAYGVIVQFDFAYDPRRASAPISKDPFFLGYFGWSDEPQHDSVR